MMKRLFSRLFIVVSLMAICYNSNASHIAGMDLTYKYVSPNVYEVTLKFYRDCFGIPMSSTSSICYGSDSLGITNTVSLPVIDTNLVTPLCLGQLTTCQGGSAYGVEEYVYRGNITLPQAATDWVFSFTTCCRNQAITTLQNPAAEGIWISATLDNVNYPTNSSPTFTSLPVTQFCINTFNTFPQFATDIDGDSLYFTLVDPWSDQGTCTTPGNAVLFNPPFSGTNPLTTANGTTLDPFTGLITLTPTQFEIGVMALECREYDAGGNEKSVIRRDIQVSVVQCNLPQFQTQIVNGVPKAYAANCGDTCLVVSLTDSVQCGSVAPDGSDFRALRPNGQPNPIYSAAPLNCFNGLTTQIQICFYKPLTHGTSKFWLKVGSDINTLLPGCGNALPEYDTINIVVVDPSVMALPVIDTVPSCQFANYVLTMPELITCASIAANGSDFILKDSQGTPYPVTAASGVGCTFQNEFTNQISFVLNAPAQGTPPFYLIAVNGNDGNTITNKCDKPVDVNDTIAILYTTNTVTVSLGPDTILCQNDAPPVLDAFWQQATYSWYLNGAPVGGNTQTLPASVSGTYVCQVSFGPNCFGWDTIVVTYILAPVVNLGSDITICANSAFPVLDAGNPGATYTWTDLNGLPLANTQTYTPTAPGTYIVTAAFGSCESSDTINVIQVAQIVTSLGNDITQCDNDPAPVLDAGITGPGFVYTWYLNSQPVGGNTQTLTVTAPGTYTVLVSQGSCTASDTINVTFLITPIPSLTPVINICPGDAFPVLDAGNPGATYLWTLNGSQVGSSQTLTTTTGGTYIVVISNGTCFTTDTTDVIVRTPTLFSAGADDIICESSSTTLAASVAGNAYAWFQNGNNLNQNTQSISVTAAGTYVCELTDINGCRTTDTVVITVEALPGKPVVNCAPSAGTGYNFVYTWTAIPNAAGYAVSVNGGPFVPNNILPVSHGLSAAPATFIVHALGTECEFGPNSDPAFCDVTIPNIVTPNGDGLNDVFFVKNLDQFSNAKMKIYNRWGNLIYENGNYKNDFNFGDQPDGVYYYVLSISQLSKDYTGNVTVYKEKK